VITMEMLGKVKRLYSRDKKSLHEIAKTTGLSRNTIRKWVRHASVSTTSVYLHTDQAKRARQMRDAFGTPNS
jgi:transposase-like protein